MYALKTIAQSLAKNLTSSNYLILKNVVRFQSQLTKVTEEEGIRRITLTDTKTRNALSVEMTASILNAIENNQDDVNLRCIVLNAEGENVFSAGHNLKHLATDEGKMVFNKFSQLMNAIIECPVPVIAAVDGLAAAAGCQLVAQCDITICTERSSFSTPGANFGVFCSTPGIAVARMVPKKIAAYMLFTGQAITAQEALTYGLVSKVTDNDKLENEIKHVTDSVKMKSRSVVELGKKFFYKQIEMPLNTAYQTGAQVMINNLYLPDGEEGLKSFAEKRPPSWKHTGK